LLNTSPLRKKLGAFCGANRDPKSSETVVRDDPSSEMLRSQGGPDPKSAEVIRNRTITEGHLGMLVLPRRNTP
jgi:hypothetical protein